MDHEEPGRYPHRPALKAMERTVRDNEDGTLNATFELVAGTAAIVVMAFAAAAMFSLGQPAGRVVIMAVAVGVLSALFTDWRAVAGIAVVASLVFVGFLTHQDAVLTGDPAPWFFTPLIGLAALLGSGYHRMTQIRATADPHGSVEDDADIAKAGVTTVFVRSDRHPGLRRARQPHSGSRRSSYHR
jgi:hypothetical protein